MSSINVTLDVLQQTKAWEVRESETKRKKTTTGFPRTAWTVSAAIQFCSNFFFFCKFSGRQWLEYEMLGKCIDCCSWCRQEDREEDWMGPPGWAGRRGPEVSGEAILARQKKNLRGRFLQKRRKERDFALAENELFFLSVRLFSAFSVFVSHPHPRGASFWLQQTRLVVDNDVDGPTGGGRRRVAASCRFREREVCKNIAVSVLKIGECCRCCGCC